jgi:hypothetical protein
MRGRKRSDPNRGRVAGSVIPLAAYRSGDKLVDDRARQAFDYRPREQEVVYSEIMAPKDGPSWL